MENETKKDKEKYTLKEYDCGYCHFTFRQYVRRVEHNAEYGYDAKHTSSQVRCPYCKQFLRTWDDGEVLGLFDRKDGKLLDITVRIE